MGFGSHVTWLKIVYNERERECVAPKNMKTRFSPARLIS
ncbi:uncharacterized protein G2W53_039299 [Senna tora]|uniref:Uncharacterized protein n=1 Tax=Senna tora TaxID=362788 RepID=A0A834W3D8_9FABA|nr:uncharacterized protein G2W53_039299 [Senna tora]